MDIASHVRIFDPSPSDELVTKRGASIEKIKDHLSKGRPSLAIFSFVNELADAIAKGGLSTGTLATIVEQEIRAESAAFIMDGNELQAAVCALLATSTVVSGAKAQANWFVTPIVFAAAIWSAFSYQATTGNLRLDALRTQVLEQARNVTLETGSKSRERSLVPDIEYRKTEPDAANKNEEIVPASVKKAVQLLRQNAVIDREELDLMWWTLGAHSELLDAQFSALRPSHAVLASCTEVGRMLKRLPATAHRNLALRSKSDTNPISLTELLTDIEDVRIKLAPLSASQATVKACPLVFPLSFALLTGNPKSIKGLEDTSMTLHSWGDRALLEAALLKLSGDPMPQV